MKSRLSARGRARSGTSVTGGPINFINARACFINYLVGLAIW
jgi:hypothetical protein